MVKTTLSIIETSTVHEASRSSDKRKPTIERPTRATLWCQYRNSWYPETTALVLSVACVIAIAIVLHSYDGQPNPKMKWGLTINAVISILATTSKVSLMFTISNSIGQLKWVWFLNRKTRSLLDAGIYDDASRGPLGSLIMLCTEARQSIASIGALLTLLVVAYDPFVQQIVSFEAVSLPQIIPNEHAVMNSAHSFLVDWDQSVTPGFLRPAIQAAYWGSDFAWDPSCPSQGCMWSQFETLAWHTKCYEDKNWTLPADCNLRVTLKDVEALPINATHTFNCTATSKTPSSAMQESQNVSLSMAYSRQSPLTPSDISLVFSGLEYMVLPTYNLESDFISSTDSEVSAVNFTDPVMLISAFDITVQNDYSVKLNVTTCELDILLDTYTVETKQDVPVTTLLTSKALTKALVSDDAGLYLHFHPSSPPSTTFFNNQDQNISFASFGLMLNESDSRSSYQYEAITNLIAAINDDFPLELGTTFGMTLPGGQNDSNDTNDYIFASLIDTNTTSLVSPGSSGEFSTGYDEAYVWGSKGPDYIMNNLAASLNKVMLDPGQNLNGTQPVYGKASVPVTLVRVAWPFVALPFGLCLSAVLFFLATVYMSFQADAPLWKSSINAYFYHGVDFDSGIWTPLATIPEMDAQAAATRARLAPVGISERLMLESTIVRTR